MTPISPSSRFYAGWNLLSGVLVVQLIAIVAMIVLARNDRRLRTCAMTSLSLGVLGDNRRRLSWEVHFSPREL